MIQHVALEIRRRDVDACVAFWALLGFDLVAAPAALAARSTWLQAGPTQIHLLYADEPVVAPEGHVAVVVADHAATLCALRDAGLDPEPRKQYWGSPRTFVRSPSGHRIEFMAFAPAADQPLREEHAMAEPTLKRGSEGQDVKDVQAALIALDFKPGAVDGVFGVYTESAVKAFQKWAQLTSDGIVGPATQAALEDAPAGWTGS